MNPYREPQKPTSRLREFFVNRARRITPLTAVLAAVLLAGLALAAATPSLRVNGIKFADGSNTFSAVYNVRAPDFACVGNGTADDTACIQAAITAAKAATSATVYLPPGTYKITSTLTFTDIQGMQFLGAGMRATSLVWAGSVGGIMLDLSGVRESRFAEFTLLGDVANPTATAIRTNGDLGNTIVATRNKFDRIFIQNYFSYGIRIATVAYQDDQTTYTGLEIYNCSTAGVSIEDANAVLHNFYDVQFQGNAIGITSILNGTGGSFNLYGCVFKSDTTVDIQTYPGSRGYTFDGVASETSAAFLQMPQASTNTSVTLTDCSVNGSSGVGPHIRAGAGSLNFIGGKYSATPNTFVVSVGNINGNTANISAIGTNFPDGNPFTGANMTLYGAVRTQGVKYAGVAGETGDSYGFERAPLDTAGAQTLYTSSSAGQVSASAGKAAGTLLVQPAQGVAGTAGLASGNGGNLFLRSSAAGTNNGGGVGTGGSVYLYPDVGGSIFIADSGGTTRGTIAPAGTSWFFPADNDARKLGAAANRFLAFFVDLTANKIGTVASANTIAPTLTLTHITGAVLVKTITAPADLASSGNGGCLDLIFDGVDTWDATGNILVGGTNTTAGTMVRFCFDNATSKWYPSRTT